MNPLSLLPISQRAAVLVAAVLCACTTTVRQHPEFATRVAQIERVSLLPPESQVTLLVFSGDNEPLDEPAKAIASSLPSLLRVQLGLHGLTLSDSGLDGERFDEAPEIRFETEQVRTSVQDALREMYASEQMSKDDALRYERSLGPQISRLMGLLDSDALLFASYSGFRKSGGEIARDVVFSVLVGAATLGNFIPVRASSGASLRVCLIEGDTGDVLWANQVTKTGGFAGEPDVAAMVKELIEPFGKPE